MYHNPLDTCPYDKCHRVMRSRMQVHLTKCKKNFPDLPKKTCPFNARHILDEPELQYHLMVCPSRENFLHHHIVHENDTLENNLLPIVQPPVAQAVQNEESWDNSAPVRSYDPMEHTKDRPVLRMVQGVSKSKRKEFRMAERRRIQNLEDNTTDKIKQPRQAKTMKARQCEVKNYVDVDVETDEENMRPCRRPRSSNVSVPIPSKQDAKDIDQRVKLSPRNVPFNYAAALHKNLKDNTSDSSNSNDDTDNIETLSKAMNQISVQDEKC